MSEGALLGLQVANDLFGGISQFAQQGAAARAADENARITETQGAYDALTSLRRSRAEAGADITMLAANGGLGGSVGDLLEANAVQREMEAANIQYEAASKARGLRYEASVARANGQAAIFGGVARAGATALKSVSDRQSAARLQAALGAPVVQPMGTIPIPVQINRYKVDRFGARGMAGPYDIKL